MGIPFPAGYQSRWNPPSTQWKEILAKAGYSLQSAEVNELQLMKTYQIQQLFQKIFTDGTFLSGGAITVTNDSTQLIVNIAAGQLYAFGYAHDVPAGTVDITGVGEEDIYLVISDQILTALPDVPNTIQDTTLLDPAVGAENYGYPGADRLQFTYQYVLGATGGILVAEFLNGQLVQGISNNDLWNQILALLALRTYEQSGSFLTTLPTLTAVDNNDTTTNPAQFLLNISNGVGYVQGYRFANTKTSLPVVRPMTGTTVNGEPHSFSTGTKVYTLNETPILSMTTVQATVNSGNINMIRGSIVNGTDDVPSQFQPVSSIVSVVAGMTTYTQGTDYQQVGNGINWLSGGSQPAVGASYVAVVDYILDLTKAVRTLTLVPSEARTVTSSTTALVHADVQNVISITRTSDSHVYVAGTDYTISTNTGIINWLIVPTTGTAITVDYEYWVHTVEGDFVSRDSFVDGSGNILYYNTPVLTPNAHAVNYLTQVSFDTTSGEGPVNSTQVFYTYNYTLGRVDVLAWDVDGIFFILQGTPSTTPVPVVPSAQYLPVAQLILPPEAFAEDMQITWYNNQAMWVTEQRNVQQQVFNLEYDISEFQLQQSALNQPTPTDKLGIFADNLSTPDLADVNSEYFSGRFDFLEQSFALPITGNSATPSVGTSTGCTLNGDIWTNTYNEILGIQQPYASTALTINEFGGVNQRAHIVLSPSVDVSITGNNLTIADQQTSTQLTWQSIANSMLMINTAPNSPVAAKIGTSSTPIQNPVLNQVPVNAEWSTDQVSYYAGGPPPANAGVVVQNSWATVLAQTQVVVEGSAATRTVTITGSNFRANDRAISATFDAIPVALTATGSTEQETATGFTNCVKANASGQFTATFTVPAGQAQGLHTISCIAHEAADFSVITSYAAANYTASAYVEYVSLWVSLSQPPADMPLCDIPAFVLTEVLGLGTPDQAILSAINGPAGYLIAYAIAQAINQSIVLTTDLLATAVTAMYQYTSIGHQVDSNLSIVDAIVNAADLTSTDVSANANAMMAASTYAQLAVCYLAIPSLDPLSQTFTFNADTFVTSVDLYFSIAPATQVAVAIATTDNGIPTKSYLAVSYLAPASVNTTGLTKFTFPQPTFLTGGTEYAFVVLTQDTDAALWAAVTGGTDPTLGLIATNPATGALLQSPDATTWQLVPNTNLKFNINVANFTVTNGILSFGNLSFTTNSSRFAFYMPFALPSEDTTVIYQYSTDGSNWNDFSPLVEVDLGGAFTGVYIRLLLNGTNTLSPTVVNSTQLLYYIWQASGAYVHRQISLPAATAEFVEVYLDTDIPGNTSIVVQTSSNGGSTWHTCSEVTADAVQLDDVYTERHYQFDFTGSDLFQHEITKIELASTVSYVTPKIRNVRVILR